MKIHERGGESVGNGFEPVCSFDWYWEGFIQIGWTDTDTKDYSLSFLPLHFHFTLHFRRENEFIMNLSSGRRWRDESLENLSRILLNSREYSWKGLQYSFESLKDSLESPKFQDFYQESGEFREPIQKLGKFQQNLTRIAIKNIKNPSWI